MQRLLLALFLALCLHVLFILSNLPGNTTIPPRIMGEETIRISLTAVGNAENVINPPENEQNEKQENYSREPEISKTEEPAKVVEKTLPRQEVKEGRPVALKAHAVKKLHHTSLNSKTTEETTRNPKKDIVQSAAPVPVSVKASPLYANNPKPDYPALARRRNWQGTVLLSVFVSEKGLVDTVKLHKSSGHTLLDKSALKTVASWQFLPGMETGHPVAMEVLIPIHFKLQ